MSVGGRGTLLISKGVKQLYSWHQKTTWIRGSKLKLQSEFTNWPGGHRLVLDRKHTEMDSYYEFYKVVLEEIEK